MPTTGKWLLNHIENKYKDRDPSVARSAVGRSAGIVGIICNFLLFLGKLLIGWIAGSVTIFADAVNNLSDVSSSVITLLGFRMARQPADEEHPYGHARYEYISGLVVAGIILLLGVELIKSAIEKIISPTSMELTALTFFVMLCAILIKSWMAVFFGKLGKSIDSPSLKATAADCRNDVIVTASILAGCLVEFLFHIRIDGYTGLAAALFILWSGIRIAKETVSPLLGQQAGQELVEHINALVQSHDKVLGTHDLLIHDYGPGQCYASIHVEFSADENPLVCHDIIDDIERDAMEQWNVNLVIHYDPVMLNDQEWQRIRNLLREILQEIDPGLSIHDIRLMRGGKQTNLAFDVAIPYGLRISRSDIQSKVEDALQERGVDYPTIINFDRKA